MSSQPVDHLHPVVDFAHRLRERLDSVAKVPLWSMTEEQQRDALTTLAKAEAQLDALKLGLLAEADRSGATTETGAGTAADWIAIETRQVRRDARSDLRLAQAVEHHEVLSAAMGRGQGQQRPGPRDRGRARPAAHHRGVRRQRRAAHTKPRPTWSRSLMTTTPKHCASWAAGSSR